jgi:hypothetical protein
MKKFRLLLIALISLFTLNTVQAQATYTKSGSYGYQYATSDTVIKNGTKTYTMYITPFAERFKLQTTIYRTRGTYTKARVITYSSIDATNWTPIDTISYAGTGATITTKSDLKTTIFEPYLKIVIAPYDSTQTIRAKHLFTIDND